MALNRKIIDGLRQRQGSRPYWTSVGGNTGLKSHLFHFPQENNARKITKTIESSLFHYHEHEKELDLSLNSHVDEMRRFFPSVSQTDIEKFKDTYQYCGFENFVEKGLVTQEELMKLKPDCLLALVQLPVIVAVESHEITIQELNDVENHILHKIIYHCIEPKDIIQEVKGSRSEKSLEKNQAAPAA